MIELERYICKNCGSEILYMKNKYCVYCKNRVDEYIQENEGFKDKIKEKKENYISKYIDKKDLFLDKALECKEGRTANKYGFAKLVSTLSEEEITNIIYLYAKKKKIDKVFDILIGIGIAMMIVPGIISFWINGFYLFCIIGVIYSLIIIGINNQNITKKYKHELNYLRYDNAIRGIKHSGYKIKYKNLETGTISFEDDKGNRHSISAFLGYNSKFR